MAQVVPLYPEIDALNTNVVAVSFGIEYWARMWMQETNSPFPVLLDPERGSYTAYGLDSSFWRAWGPRNMLYYAKALLRGKKLQEHRGDTDQMGGNFIVDAEGVVRFTYPSRDPTDRPGIGELMDVLTTLNQEQSK